MAGDTIGSVNAGETGCAQFRFSVQKRYEQPQSPSIATFDPPSSVHQNKDTSDTKEVNNRCGPIIGYTKEDSVDLNLESLKALEKDYMHQKSQMESGNIPSELEDMKFEGDISSIVIDPRRLDQDDSQL